MQDTKRTKLHRLILALLATLIVCIQARPAKPTTIVGNPNIAAVLEIATGLELVSATAEIGEVELGVCAGGTVVMDVDEVVNLLTEPLFVSPLGTYCDLRLEFVGPLRLLVEDGHDERVEVKLTLGFLDVDVTQDVDVQATGDDLGVDLSGNVWLDASLYIEAGADGVLDDEDAAHDDIVDTIKLGAVWTTD